MYNQPMRHYDISDKDREAIEKKELEEFDHRRLRGTGYDMMKIRDQGWGKIFPEKASGKEVVLEWHVDYAPDEEWPEYAARNSLPRGKFKLKVGSEEAIIDKDAFERLLRWV
jgi:hypothetical protein